jgi:glycosyltransferase involved in cell wall biosynthesis/LmbE family N-acetylglucosaminyl deacetylase
LLEQTIIPYVPQTHIHANSVLVLAPHPDDEVFGCGGAIVSHVANRIPLQVVILSSGEAGGDAAIRQAESKAAAVILGYGIPNFWDYIDRKIVYSEALVQRIMDLVEVHRVDLIYCPSELELHPDHRQIALACKAVLNRIGGLLQIAFYEVSAPLRPNLLLDITPYLAIKTAAMQCFPSQQQNQAYVEQISALNRYRTYSLPAHVQAAEAFHLIGHKQLSRSYAIGNVQPIVKQSPAPPLVSILIRSMDRIWLGEALASIALQDYQHIEVIVVAATPDHGPVSNRFGPFPVTLIETSVPLSRTQAANRALDLANGELLLLLDDDDWLMPEHISRLAATLSALSLYRAAYTGVALVDTNNQPLGNSFEYAYDATQLHARNLTPIHGVLFHRSLVKEGCRFDESLDQYEDWDFWLQISRKTVMAHISGVSAAYRVHGSSGVHDDAAKVNQDILYRKWQALLSHEEIDTIMERLWRYSTLLDSNCHLNQALQNTRDSNALLAKQFALIENQFTALLSSKSWRITAPLRYSIQLLHHLNRYVRYGFYLLLHPQELFRLIWRARHIYKLHGITGLRYAIKHKAPQTTNPQDLDYERWITVAEPKPIDYAGLSKTARGWKKQVRISIAMPTYNSNLAFLKAAIQSVQDQVYPHWELCIADDASTEPELRAFLAHLPTTDVRIKVMVRAHNGHIAAASNSALSLASGEYIALLDHDDLLHPLALWHIAKAINLHPDAGILYSDEDKLNSAGARCNPYFKCDFNPELMLAHNMISHLGCYRKSWLDAVGGFREGLDGSQDYDLALRIIEKIPAAQIIHIPHVLYHWRITPESTAHNLNTKSYAQSAAIRALTDHLVRRGLSGTVMPCPEMPHIGYRVQFDCPLPQPMVSIVIPTRDKAALLETCIDSILTKTSYTNYEIIVMDNGSAESATFKLFDRLKVKRVRIIRDESPFNYPALNNQAVQHSQGQYICLMNNDIEIITPGWLEEMVSFASQPSIGAVGARLWYPNDRIQHAGVIVGLGGVAGHAFVNLKRGEPGYFGRALVHQSYSAVTAACLVVRKSIYEEVGGLDERLAIAFNDVDFCLRIRDAGYRNVWTPYAEMYHHESVSRGSEDTPQKKARFDQECDFIRRRWADMTAYDPAYSPNLTLGSHHFAMAYPPRTIVRRSLAAPVADPTI